MANYAPALGLDKNTNPIQNAPPPVSVLAVYSSENASASSVISVTHNTTLVEIAAVGGPAVMRFVRTSDAATAATSVISEAGTANLSHVIPSGVVRQFILPRETSGSNGASIQGINRAEGLYQRIAYKSIGVASVIMTEYGF